jgi:hypothetical protein
MAIYGTRECGQAYFLFLVSRGPGRSHGRFRQLLFEFLAPRIKISSFKTIESGVLLKKKPVSDCWKWFVGHGDVTCHVSVTNVEYVGGWVTTG